MKKTENKYINKYFTYTNTTNLRKKDFLSEENIKEEKGKLNYEIDWEFIEQLAQRMSKNKDRYSLNNWKNNIDIEKLKQALIRHTIEVLKNSYSDDNRDFGHLEAIALNAMFINYQLKKNNEENKG